jgi:MerR family transcriptional regulator, thiopeptide resistance regulator
MSYTVKQLAQMAGVSARTLHYYDQIGLLKPGSVGENGYRYYGEDSLLKLQQILLYRELDLPLAQIRQIMGRRDFDVLAALEGHKAELLKRIVQMERLIGTVEHTIGHLKGEQAMSDKQIFEGFSEEEQAAYEQEAMRLYDPEIVKASNRRWKAYSEAEKKSILEESKAIYLDYVQAMPKGPASSDAQACVERWRKNMDHFWTPSIPQLLGLAEMYVSDERFLKNINTIHPGLAEFILEAVKVYVKSHGG